MTVELISVGTEILLGNIVNTNAAFLAEQCALLGLSCYYQTVVGDNRQRLFDTLTLALSRSDVVILSGGLGPTEDDLTTEVTACVFGRELVEDPHTKEKLAEDFRQLDIHHVTENNWKMALVPEGATVVDNRNGMAPGIILTGTVPGQEKAGKRTAILLPGVPGEIRPMFTQDIVPCLRSMQSEGIYSHMVKICGIGESQVETMIRDLVDAQKNPTIAPYAKTGEVHLRLTARADTEEKAEEMMAPVLAELKKRFGVHLFTTEESVTLEETIVTFLKERHMTVTTAESCTGGLLAGRLLNVPGASDVYREGFITYADEAKEQILGVPEEILETKGAVSEETAARMAEGAAAAAKADAALSVTGLAGPGGGTQEKPVGLVYIGCQVGSTVQVREYHFTGNREKIREYAVVRALTFLREELLS